MLIVVSVAADDDSYRQFHCSGSVYFLILGKGNLHWIKKATNNLLHTLQSRVIGEAQNGAV